MRGRARHVSMLALLAAASSGCPKRAKPVARDAGARDAGATQAPEGGAAQHAPVSITAAA